MYFAVIFDTLSLSCFSLLYVFLFSHRFLLFFSVPSRAWKGNEESRENGRRRIGRNGSRTFVVLLFRFFVSRHFKKKVYTIRSTFIQSNPFCLLFSAALSPFYFLWYIFLFLLLFLPLYSVFVVFFPNKCVCKKREEWKLETHESVSFRFW